MKSTPPSVSLKKDINYFHPKQFFKRERRKSKSKFRENIHPSFLRWLAIKVYIFTFYLSWPLRDWSWRLIDWLLKRALRVFQSLNLCQQKTYGQIICGVLIRCVRNCSEILRQIITINIYIFYDSESHFTANFAHILHSNFSTVWNMHK